MAPAEGRRRKALEKNESGREREGISMRGWGHRSETDTGFTPCLPHGRF